VLLIRLPIKGFRLEGLAFAVHQSVSARRQHHFGLALYLFLLQDHGREDVRKLHLRAATLLFAGERHRGVGHEEEQVDHCPGAPLEEEGWVGPRIVSRRLDGNGPLREEADRVFIPLLEGVH